MHISDRIGARLKLQGLHVLMTVAQAGSMNKAAALLNTTQSAVSRWIAELEQAVGAKLLDRNAQGVEPTHYGRALLQRGVVVFDELRQGVKDIEFLSGPTGGELRIGSSPSMSEGIVLPIVEKLTQQHPRIVFHVAIHGMPGIVDELRMRHIDLGFVQMTGPIDEGDIDQAPLFDDRLVVVVGHGNPWARRRKIRLADLVDEPWTWAGAGTRFDVDVADAFRANGLKPPRATVYADAINMRTRLAANGRFLAIIPAFAIKLMPGRPPLKVLPVELPSTRRQIGIITVKNRAPSRLAELFIERAKQIAKSIEA